MSEYRTKQVIKSFQIPEGAPSEKMVRMACQHMKDRKDFKASRENTTSRARLDDSRFDFEIIITFNSIRVNLYNATDADLFWLGTHYQNAYSGKL